MPSSKEPMPPVLFSDRYQIIGVLGDGGFGKTFLVEDMQGPSNRQCVLKQLKPVYDNSQTSQMVKDRFGREAAILEKLGEAHDQIPRLYAYFSEADQFYLVEEWVAGDTLTQRVQQAGPLSEKAVQTLIAGLLSAIAHVHREGIVHRDIKPDNIILRARDGKPVLIDFGAVKETMNTLIDSHAHSSHSIVVGTPGYMPAEQLSGRPVFASDIYSVGMTAIYALTGKVPQALDIDSRTGELLWRQHAPKVSTEFGNFLDCATHMSAQSRFPTVEEMRSILNTLILNGMMALPAGLSAGLPQRRQSSEATVSASPASTPVDSAYAGQQFGQLSGQPSGQWKNAVIIGGMVGFSLLLGILVVMDRLPDAMGDRLATSDPATADSANQDASDAVAKKPTPATQTSDKPSKISTPDPVQVTAPDQPQAASIPGENSTIAGDSGDSNATIAGQAGSKNIRSGPGINYDTAHIAYPGDRVVIRDTSTDAGGYTWYKVYFPKSGADGWIASQLVNRD